MPEEQWANVNLVCCNYRKGVVGTTRTITVNVEKECTSDCEAVECPLWSPKSLIKSHLGR